MSRHGRRVAAQQAGPAVAADGVLRPRLRCPGGARAMGRDIVNLYKVPTHGHLAKYDLRFMLNLSLTHQVARHFETDNGAAHQLLVELGPGPGALTRSLLTRPSVGVFGIEIDSRFNPLLSQVEQETRGRFRWANANVMEIDEFALIARHYPEFARANERLRTRGPLENEERSEAAARERRATASGRQPASADDSGSTWWSAGVPSVQVIGNLPFDAATNLATRYAADCSRKAGIFRFGRVPIHLFLQKEVAERVVAVPDHPEYSRLSVVLQNFFACRVRQTFREMTYFPRTEVLGALVTLTPRAAPLVDVDASALGAFTELAMRPQLRQKGILKALRKMMPEEVALYVLSELAIDGSMLAYQLSVTELARMALLWVRYLEASSQAPPGERTFGHLETIFDKEAAARDYDFERAKYERRERERGGDSAIPSW